MRHLFIFAIITTAALALTGSAFAQETQPERTPSEDFLDHAETGLRALGEGVAGAINSLSASAEERTEQSRERRRRRRAEQASGEAVATARASAETVRTTATPATEENALDRTERELEEIGEGVSNRLRGLFNRE